MELGLTSTRAASVSDGETTSRTFGTELSVDINPNFGSAYANVEIEVNVGASLGEGKSEEPVLREQNRKLLGQPAKPRKRRNASADIAKDFFLSKLGEEKRKQIHKKRKLQLAFLSTVTNMNRTLKSKDPMSLFLQPLIIRGTWKWY